MARPAEKRVNKTTLGNGIRILTKSMPHVRSISMGVWVNAGARDESPSESGLSHLIEHMIFKGTERRSAFQIAKEFDAIGGHANAFTAMENTCYHARVMDVHLETMVDILSDILLNSVFDATEVDRERPVILQEIGMVEDNPDEYVHLLSGHNFWGDHPLGRSILGTRENILGFDAETIKTFFYRLYQPERMVISAAGNVDHDALVDLLAGTFESIPSGNPMPERISPSTHAGTGVHYRDLEQTHLCISAPGLSITDPKRFAGSLLNTILGGNMSSRLFQQIRENRGLAYSVYSFVNPHIDTGMFGVYAGVDPSRAIESIQLILNELHRLTVERITEQEISAAREYTKGNLLLAQESNDNQMVRLAQNEIHFGRYSPLKEVMDRIDAVSCDDLINLANAIFRTDQLALTVLGPMTDKNAFDHLISV